ncbi:MAG: DNA internalization-related competence protein ComEC/Rec2 [Roseburia sp.]
MGIWRRPLCRIAAGFLLGILFGVYGCTWYLVLAAVVLAGCCLYACQGSGAGRQRFFYMAVTAVSLMGALVLGHFRYGEAQQFREQYLPGLQDGMQLTVQGELYQKEYKNGQYIYYLKSCIVGLSKEHMPGITPVSCNHILFYSDSDACGIGETLVLNGTVELWKPAVNEGNFDERAYYQAQQLDFKLKDGKVLAVYGETNQVKEWLYHLRARLGKVYSECLSSEDGGVLSTLLLGDKAYLDGEIKDLYQKTGISHVLAISGLHISVIGMSIYRLLRRFGMGFGSSGVLSAGVMLCYGSMVGMGTSVKRAVLMFCIMLLAQFLGRSYDSLSALAAAALWLLWDNPEILFYAGFLLSFAAVLGVVCIGGRLAGEKQNGRKKHWERIRESLLVSASIQLATVPLMAWFYYEIPVYAMLANLFVLPFVAYVVYLGVGGGLLGMLWTVGAEILLFPCHLILAWFDGICRFCTSLPGAVYICGRPSLWKLAVYYCLLALAVCFAGHQRLHKTNKAEKTEEIVKREGTWRTLGIGVILIVFLLFHPTGGFEIDVLDVGQGDGIFIRSQNGRTMFVDGGSSSVSKVGKYRMLPFFKAKGIRRIDFWAVSHTDEDHISGLLEILASGYPIDCLLVSEDIVRDEAFESLRTLAGEQGTEVLFVQKGDVLHLGDARIEILSPERGADGEDKNANSLVFYYEEGDFCGLFTGDIGENEERCLLEEGAIKKVDFYKAAHHGSRYSNSAELLQALRPEIAVISCAKENSYGHPHQETLERLQEVGCDIYFTMYGGQITLGADEDGLSVKYPLMTYK